MLPQINKQPVSSLPDRLGTYILAVLAVSALTGVMYLIGRDTLGEGVIALLYLVPVSWSAARWGQGPGIAAAVSAASAFNFFFIPPFYTFYIGNLEGWLLLAIFLVVAIVIVGRIQSGLTQAQVHEREAVFMYELSAALSGSQTAETIAHILAEHIQQLYQTSQVQVYVKKNGHAITISTPEGSAIGGKADLVLPILSADGLAGEIRLWQGEVSLPAADNRLMQNFSTQGSLALERARLVQLQTQNY
jgi:two-component system sensor histidine kinase KdpD